MDIKQRVFAGPRGIRGSELQGWKSSWILLVVGAVTVALVLLARRYGHHQTRRKLPPGPRNWPIIGAFLAMDPVLENAFEKLAAQFGPIVHFRLGVQTVVLVSSAEAAEELLKHKDAEFADRATTMNKLLAKYTGMESTVMAFANYDRFFRLCRKISMTELLTVAKLNSWEELRRNEMAVMVEKILGQISMEQDSNKLGGDGNYSGDVTAAESRAESCTVVGMRDAVTDTIQNIIFVMIIGKRFDDLPETDELREFPQLLDEQMEFVMKFNVIDFFPFLEWLDPQGILKDLKKFAKRQRDFFQRILERHRQARKLNNERSSSNFVDTLLSFQEEGNGEVSDQVVIGVVLSMWMAGIHTTSAQVEWVLLELARHPHLLERLQVEIDGVAKEGPIQEADLQAMPILNAVVLETLRLHPISTTTFPHINMRPSTLGDYSIPSNTAVILNIRSISRDPKTWPDPLQFNPDRFLLDPTLSSKPIANGTDFHLLTFGSGRRMCPGYNLAMVLLLRTVATLVHAFELSPPPGYDAKDLSTEVGVSHIQQPISHLQLTCRPRLSCHRYHSNM